LGDYAQAPALLHTLGYRESGQSVLAQSLRRFGVKQEKRRQMLVSGKKGQSSSQNVLAFFRKSS